MSSLVGLHNIQANPASIADGHSIASYLVDAAGALLTSSLIGAKQRLDVNLPSEFAEDSAHSSGDYGQQVLAVRSDAGGSLVSADGDYSPLQVDADGNLRVAATINQAGDYAEDSAHTTGDVGLFSLAVRRDTRSSGVSADGDYASFNMNAVGELWVKDADSLAQLVTANSTLTSILADTATIDSNTASILSELLAQGTTLDNIETEQLAQGVTLDAILADTATIDSQTLSISNTLTALSKAEDSAHSSGDQGIQALAVRKDTPGSLVSADGDYAPLQVDATGNLRVSGSISLSGQYAEDSVAASGDIGLFSLAVRRDGSSSNVSAAGDYSEFQTWSEGSLRVVDISNGAILQQQVSVTNTAAQVPAANLANRKSLMLQNTGANKLWIGSATVTTSGATAGIELPANSFMELEAGPALNVYAVKVGATGNNLNVLEMS